MLSPIQSGDSALTLAAYNRLPASGLPLVGVHCPHRSLPSTNQSGDVGVERRKTVGSRAGEGSGMVVEKCCDESIKAE